MIPTNLISGVTFWVFKALWESRDETYKLLSKQLKQSIFHASKEYQASYIARHGFIKLEELSSSVELSKVYVAPALVDQSIPFYPLSKKVIHHKEIDYLKRLKLAYDGLELAQKHKHMIVRGEPGIGKTTFLQKLGLEAFNEVNHSLANAHIPVFIQTTKCLDKEFNLQSMIEEEFEACGFPEPDGFVESALKRGKLLILIDELNILSIARRDHIVLKIKDFSDLYRDNRIVLAGRKSKRPHALIHFQTVSILGFSSTQAQNYISKIHQVQHEEEIPPKVCQLIWQKIGENNKATKFIVHNPLYLNIVLSQYKTSSKIFFGKTVIYEKILANLLGKSVYPNAVDHSPSDLESTGETRLNILTEIAYVCLKSGRLYFHKAEIKRLYTAIVKKKGIDKNSLDLNAIREDYLANFIVYVDKNLCQFNNLLIQQLLAAYYLMDNLKTLDETADQFLDTPAWGDVFIFLAGMQGADYLISIIQDGIFSKINSPQLLPFIQWISSISEDVCISLDQTANRCYAVFMVFEIILLFDNRNQDRHIISNILKQIKEIITLLDPECQIITPLNSKVRTSDSVSISHFIDPLITRGLSLDRLLDLAEILSRKAESYRLINPAKFYQLKAIIQHLKQQLRGKNVSVYHRKICEKNLYKLWIQSLDISDSLLNFTARDLHSFYLYCRGTCLIINCLKEAFYVSGELRDDVTQALFNSAVNSSPVVYQF